MIDVHIRDERPGDRYAIHSVVGAAFGRRDEADLVTRLRDEGVVLASLVAVNEEKIAGHILFSRMEVVTENASIPAVALAPMAVIPAVQRRGIGGKLVRFGLDRLRNLGERVVFVLGHPDYYPRFGFSPETAQHIASPFPSAAFMGIELAPGALRDVSGRVRYPSAFGLPSAIE